MLKICPTSLFSTKQEFLNYVHIYNSNYRVHSDSKNNYLDLMKMYAEAEDYRTLLRNSNYISLAYRTLQDWNMDQRGAKLVGLSDFRNSLHVSVVMVNPGGTGNPSLLISERFAPFPPRICLISLPPSSKS